MTSWLALTWYPFSKKIPVHEALYLISKLVDCETLTVIKIYFTSTFFSFKFIFYTQSKGNAMGSSISHVVANIFMQHWKNLALNSWHHKPKCWYRLVDDTYIVWPHGLISLHAFPNHLNSLSSHIQFTMELEEQSSLSFLDIFVSQSPNGPLSFWFFCKKTHMEWYLHAQFHHHPTK